MSNATGRNISVLVSWQLDFMESIARSGIRVVLLGIMLLGIVMAFAVGTGTSRAQSGSTGGSIGNDDKSLSGTRSEPAASSEKPERTVRPVEKSRPSPRTKRKSAEPSASQPYSPQGSGVKSNGNCVCKDHCNEFAARGQSNPAQTRQCISSCQQNYSGCNRGSLR